MLALLSLLAAPPAADADDDSAAAAPPPPTMAASLEAFFSPEGGGVSALKLPRREPKFCVTIAIFAMSCVVLPLPLELPPPPPPPPPPIIGTGEVGDVGGNPPKSERGELSLSDDSAWRSHCFCLALRQPCLKISISEWAKQSTSSCVNPSRLSRGLLALLPLSSICFTRRALVGGE